MTDTTTIKEFFTEEQWDAIFAAMGDYQDYGDEEADLADQVKSKITTLFS